MKKFTLLLFLCTIYNIMVAQSVVDRTIIDKDSRGIIESVQFSKKDISLPIPSSAAVYFKNYLKVPSADIEFREIPHYSKDRETKHEHFDQYYKGVLVEGAGYNFHYKHGDMFHAHGHYVPIQDINVKPGITVEKARDIFIAYKKIPANAVKNFISNLIIKEISDKTNIENPVPKLVYRIYLLADHTNNNEVGFIDAHTGALLETEPRIINFSAVGTFSTRYNGTRQGITQHYDGGFHLADSTRGAIIHTWNLEGRIDTINRIELTDNDNNWTTAEHTDNRDMALDVHWGLQQIYDYLFHHHGINSFDNNPNNGFAIDAYIKYDTGNAADNAYWDPTMQILYFGEGRNRYRPVACLDAVAHEYGHGITQFQIGWGNNQRHFHEGMSDIWGVILEHRINPNSNSVWQIGEQITKNYQCLRNIQNTNDSNVEIKIADTFNSAQYNNAVGNLQPYVQGGVFSHWFYLLVNGGSGVNDLGNSYRVYGVGFDTAENLIINAVFNNFLRNKTTYEGLRTSFIQAANGNDLLIQQIENAWYAVGVGSKPTQLQLSGPSTVCDQAAYTIANLPPGATMQWSAINSNLQLVSAQDSTAVFRKISNGKSTLRAILAIGDSSITLNRAVDVGVPLRPWIMNDTVINKGSSVSYDMCIGQGTTSLYLMLINPDNSADVGSWEVHKPANVDAFSIVQNGNHLFVNPLKKGGGFFTVTSHNACGSSEEMRIYLTITDCEGGTIPIDPPSLPTNFTLAPNPATDIVTVQLQEDTPANQTFSAQGVNNTPSSGIIEIQLWSAGGLIRTYKTDQRTFQIPVSGFAKGMYFVRVIKDGKTYSQKLLKK